MKIYALLLPALMWACSSNGDTKVVSGGGTDVSNARIVGQVFASDSTAAASVVVRLYPKSQNPYLNLVKGTGRVYETKTDINGRYEIAVKDTGEFVLDCGNAQSNEKSFRFGVRLSLDSLFREEKVVLTKPGAIKLSIPVALREKDGLYAYVPGTSYFVHIEESKILDDSVYVFQDLPAGYLPALHFALINDAELDEVEKLEIEVKESDTTEVKD